MPAKKKKFIDKKNAVTFHLVHRSQRDPLQADEDAPQHVLLSAGPGEKELTARKEQERKFGVFYEDDYDYLQHLKDVEELYEVEPIADQSRSKLPPGLAPNAAEKPRLNLPSSVFASAAETDVGLLNKAVPLRGPQLDWDPDIVAAMDEDFDFDDPENALDDDFMAVANVGGSGEEDMDENDSDHGDKAAEPGDDNVYKGCKPETAAKDGDSDADSDGDSDADSDEDTDFASDEAEGLSDADEVGSLDGDMFGDVETKSRFTDYSMTSSVIKRTEGLTLLDDRFEKLYQQYEDDEIGALDQEDIPGHVTAESELLNSVMQEYELQQREIKLKDAVQKATEMPEDSGSEDDTELVKMVIEEPKEKWDCESILSTYSTIYNHPKTIEVPKKPRPIKLTKRVEIPAEALPARGLTRKQLETATSTIDSVEHANTYRPKDETLDEKKARKQAIKEEKKLRREEKKSNKLAFKREQLRQESERRNVKQNLQGFTIS